MPMPQRAETYVRYRSAAALERHARVMAEAGWSKPGVTVSPQLRTHHGLMFWRFRRPRLDAHYVRPPWDD
jgi:hypothetical protein